MADPGQADQSGHCEHGTLALVPTRPWRCQCHRQPTGLYAQGDAQRLTDLDNPGCDRSPSPGKQTPLLSETMKSVTVNPTWNVPPSIMYNEYMPALARDPTVLARMGLNVSYGPDGSVHVSQPPGGANVLGRLRFNFPNRFLVYQHDTNERFMFAREVRAYSHGCMRVQDPAKYAEVLLNIARPSEHWTSRRSSECSAGASRIFSCNPRKSGCT
jgi:Uncharacterized protein conserved in bacteria